MTIKFASSLHHLVHVTAFTNGIKPKPGREKKLDGKQEAYLVAMACSDAPDDRESWTMQLLADRLLELEVIDEAYLFRG
ncbi:MAG: hypothetical protein AAFR56_18705 [Chloroflexota bacterium]